VDANLPVSLSKAENVVATLNKTLSLADREMEDAVRQTRDLHRQALAKKEGEIEDLRRALAAKERAVDAAREAQAARIGTLEARVRDLEAQAADAEAENRQLRDEYQALRTEAVAVEQRATGERRHLEAERAAWEAKLEAERAGWAARAEAEAERLAGERAAVEDLRARLRAAQEAEREAARRLQEHVEVHAEKVAELQRDAVEARAAVESNRRAQAELAEARQLVAQAREAVREEEHKRRAAVSKLQAERKHRLRSSELDEIKQKLVGERRARKALEQWLQSELQSREELEVLFRALRDIALSRPQRAGEVGEVIGLIKRYESRVVAQEARRQTLGEAAAGLVDPDSRALRDELGRLKSLLVDKLADVRQEGRP